MLLFGSFLAWAVYDRISVKTRPSLGPLGNAKGTLAGDIAAVGIRTLLYSSFCCWAATTGWSVRCRLR